ncbi:M3 family metallopeptidase [Pelomonas sp. KK5]|uniref:M3 family metallopeptidase n=1 Tax=Pelomonas sp. KK5 TaxID=1855730 RepID=UPI0018E9C6AD|nr:M3 family metallopeptidase [Pelomonas sp. KK5]
MDDKNPLLASDSGLPAFDAIRPDHIGPAIDELVSRCEQALARLAAPGFPPDFRQLGETLDPPLQALAFAWDTVQHLQGVLDTPALRSAIAAAQPRVTGLYARLSSDSQLFALLRGAEGGEALLPAERQALSNSLRSLRLGGAELDAAGQARFKASVQRSAVLSREFANHVQDATDAFVLHVDAADLDGLPQDVLDRLAADGRYRLTLQQPCLGPVLQYARKRALRETLYRANVTRASELGPAALDNGPVIAEILALRHERAALLGLPHHAATSLASKMAEDAAQVETFLLDLARRARPMAEQELAELRAFAAERLGIDDLQPWDLAYAAEQLRRERHAFSEQELTPYFPLERVLDGLFRLSESLFDITITADDSATAAWHPSVRGWRIETRAGALLGRFLLDPFARAAKRGGAWMNGAQARWRRPDGSLRTALAYLVTNSAAPVEGRRALLRHGEVVTLFHEFGHGLHHLLSTVEVPGVAGISGVEWDAVELPSQWMENFAWQWETLQRISAHADTGEALPRELFERMTAARNFQNGLTLLRQVEFSLFDIRLHADPARAGAAQSVMDEVRAEVSLLAPPGYNRFQNAFSHIWAGGYAAGYYSYLWAEVLACDAWETFEAQGVEAGRRWREQVLEVGGSRPMADSVRAFLGRAPAIDALLRQRGLAPA